MSSLVDKSRHLKSSPSFNALPCGKILTMRWQVSPSKHLQKYLNTPDEKRDGKLCTVGSDGVGNGICFTTIGSWDDIRGGGLFQIFSEFLGEGKIFMCFMLHLPTTRPRKAHPKKSAKKYRDFRGRERL
ncbi:hypothetical protein NC651_027840 [Populus alba x Populus x berolinensis]|nr:hypothetical protein NC651_027840 [Populus alba x Populus x berolinensis]